jgi:hypothetical protein
MKHRQLRIAWSAAWGIVAVLMVALWVRSYWWIDQVVRVTSTAVEECCEYDGQIVFSWRNSVQAVSAYSATIGEGWHLMPFSVQDWHRSSPPLPGQRIFRAFGGIANEFVVPCWAPTLVAIIFTSLPWIGSMSWQFSLRTLLIATSLVAAALGAIVWVTRL